MNHEKWMNQDYCFSFPIWFESDFKLTTAIYSSINGEEFTRGDMLPTTNNQSNRLQAESGSQGRNHLFKSLLWFIGSSSGAWRCTTTHWEPSVQREMKCFKVKRERFSPEEARQKETLLDPLSQTLCRWGLFVQWDVSEKQNEFTNVYQCWLINFL